MDRAAVTAVDDFRSLDIELAQPGRGATPERFRALWDLAARSPTLGRLAEAHFDAIAILCEADREPPTPARFGVWAAGGPNPATIRQTGTTLELTGEKHWCSGASIATHALVTAADEASNALVLVDLAADGVRLSDSDWTSPAFHEVDTRTVMFQVELTDGDVIGVDDWYLRRPGFWHGAVGVAACWAGCADGLIGRIRDEWRTDDHALAHLGAIDATLWTIRAMIDAAGREIDAAPHDVPAAHVLALRVRGQVDLMVGDITTRIARAIGPGPLAHRTDLHTTLVETDLYRRQCHAERDLADLGDLTLHAPDDDAIV